MKNLRINEADGQQRTIPLTDKRSFCIGRSEQSDIILADKKVSRRHAEISLIGEEVFILDLGSHAGTRVNDSLINQKISIFAGDKIRLGDTVLELTDTITTMEKVPTPEITSPKVVAEATEPSKQQRKMPIYTAQQSISEMYTDTMLELGKEIQNRVLDVLNIGNFSGMDVGNKEVRTKVEQTVDSILKEVRHKIPANIPMDKFRQIVIDDLIGLGPLSPLLRDAQISEIMINGSKNIFVESKGLLYRAASIFTSESHLLSIVQRIVDPLGRRIDSSSPMVDARLEDGSRVNAIIPPLALDGALVTIRKFPSKRLVIDDLVKFGSLTENMAAFLKEAVRSRRNILVSGGTGSGKTTLLNVLSQFIPENERIITVEDSAELQLTHENLCRLETRPANIEGQGRVTIRDLVINTLRMRPDRIIVGECRGAEALDMMQAMNTGHDGSMTTCHANNPRDALARLENMVMMAGFELPSTAIREQIASAIHLIVQQSRLPDGSRKITRISEITGRENNTILMQDIFNFEQEGFDDKFKVIGHHTATGNIPRFIEELRIAGDLQLDMAVFVPEG